MSLAANQSVSKFTSSKAPFYCPQPKQLIKNQKTLTWSAPGGWKSYDQSFVQKISEFRGAQWAGVNIGQIACVYTGTNKLTFPVILVFNKLTTAPSSGSWSSNLHKNKQRYASGYYSCPSLTISNCPFHPVIKKTARNPYQDLNAIKQEPASQQQGF